MITGIHVPRSIQRVVVVACMAFLVLHAAAEARIAVPPAIGPETAVRVGELLKAGIQVIDGKAMRGRTRF